MKTIKISLIVACLVTAFFTGQVSAKKATVEEARTVAENWIKAVIRQKDSWGEHDNAVVSEIQQLKRKGKQLGFYCKVEPEGYIIVSLHKGLAPVKAYSAMSELDPMSDEGMADLLKYKMEKIIKDVETIVGKKIDDVSDELMDAAAEVKYRNSWNSLTVKDKIFKPKPKSKSKPDAEAQAAAQPQMQTMSLWSEMMYSPGDILLKTSWHQQPPYNKQCPDEGCSWSGYNYWNSRVRVGCVATAGAQILRYWNYPPYGSDGVIIPWKDLRLYYSYFYNADNGQRGFTTEYGNATPQEIDAVALLCHRVGVNVDMDYDCEESGAYTEDMERVFENYWYSNSCSRTDRDDTTAINWFTMLKNQFNQNRPVQYRVEGHSIVGDGWQYVDDDAGMLQQYHMNYGWSNIRTAWYTLDTLHLGGVSEEFVLKDIVPGIALDNTLAGVYDWTLYPYYYFDKDAHGNDATFEAGLKFQMLNPGLIIEGRGTGDEAISFAGSNEMDDFGLFQLHTVFFYHGDEENKERIKIYDGEIRLKNYGQIVFHD